MAFTEIDIKHMQHAIDLAEKGCGLNHPNPLVGAVVAKGETVLGQAYHLYRNREHAEVIALRQAGEDSKGATLYVNLEPCAHQCRTPPCTNSILAAGIERVVFSVQDPDERVRGKGEMILRSRGINVESGLLAEKATELNRDYLKAKLTGLPWVIVKVAMSLDGKIGLPNLQGEYFSCAESLKLVHNLRAWCDCIMVGAGTVRIDNPQLTCRLDSFKDVEQDITEEMMYPFPADNSNPARVIISGKLNMPENSNIFNTQDARTIVITCEDAPHEMVEKLKAAGVEIMITDSRNGLINTEPAFRGLANMGFHNVMIEGGGQLIGSLVEHKMVDEIYLSIAPILIGGSNSPTWLNRQVTSNIKNSPTLKNTGLFNTGRDVLVRARFNQISTDVF